MNGDLRALGALPLAVADLAVGLALVQYVSVPAGAVLGVFGVFVLLTATYRAIRRDDTPDSRRQVA